MMNKKMLLEAIELEKVIVGMSKNPIDFGFWSLKFNPKQEELFKKFASIIEDLYDGSVELQVVKQKYYCDKNNYLSEFLCDVCGEKSNILDSYEDCEHCNAPLEHLHRFTGGRVTRVRMEELKRRLTEQGVSA
jgi:hypothetical protein